MLLVFSESSLTQNSSIWPLFFHINNVLEFTLKSEQQLLYFLFLLFVVMLFILCALWRCKGHLLIFLFLFCKEH